VHTDLLGFVLTVHCGLVLVLPGRTKVIKQLPAAKEKHADFETDCFDQQIFYNRAEIASGTKRECDTQGILAVM
jgi:hypothetical protein